MCDVPKAREDIMRGAPPKREKSASSRSTMRMAMGRLFSSLLYCTRSHLLIPAALDNGTRFAVPHCVSGKSGATKACTGINPSPTTSDPTESGPLRILHSVGRESPFYDPPACHPILQHVLGVGGRLDPPQVPRGVLISFLRPSHPQTIM